MRTCSLVVLTLLWISCVDTFAQAPAKTVLDGAYTEAQARRGQAAYEKSCRSCHKDDLAGFNGPPLVGEQFMDRWREFDLDVLFNVIKDTMPFNARGSLSDSAYLDILSYIVERNGFPTGRDELTSDSIHHTLLLSKQGPKPLPTSSQVVVVGCFIPAPNHTWTLGNASQPARTLDAFELKVDELEAAKSRPLGSLSFRLQNLEDLPSLRFDPSQDYRVVVKGILVRQPGKERINVTALQPIAPGCAR